MEHLIAVQLNSLDAWYEPVNILNIVNLEISCEILQHSCIAVYQCVIHPLTDKGIDKTCSIQPEGEGGAI